MHSEGPLNRKPAIPSTLDPSETTSVVEAAALLLARAIQETRKPVEDLGGALQLMSRTALAPEGLAEQLAVCVESLQFHDRLVQQLACARELLAGILSQKAPDLGACGAGRWNAVLAAVRCGNGEMADAGARGTCELF
ncbi:MAG TPA: hypothetical protein VFB37_02250 [Steroidobacteraceae bacterium]|nr:hypothetical protein [Steroidobacteraceae bacterium]